MGECFAETWLLYAAPKVADPDQWSLSRIVWRDARGYLVESGETSLAPEWREYIEAADHFIVAIGRHEAMIELRAICALRVADHVANHNAAKSAAEAVREAMQRDIEAWLSAPIAEKPTLGVISGGKLT